MWQIAVDERGARLVQGARWAFFLGVAMVVLGIVGGVALLIAGNTLFGLILFGLMALPGVILTQTLGKSRERKITAVVKSSAVADGVNVTLRDETNKIHELSTDADTVRAILASLTQSE